MNSKNLNGDMRQPELMLGRQPSRVAPSIDIVRSQKSGGAAFSLACQCSGLNDNEIYLPLGVDAGYFSNMKKGAATLKSDLLARFCELVGNRVYPEWIAYQLGCTLVQIESETERQLRIEREKLNELTKENDLLKKLLVGKTV